MLGKVTGFEVKYNINPLSLPELVLRMIKQANQMKSDADRLAGLLLLACLLPPYYSLLLPA